MISLVVAVAENNVIGHAGRLPWHLPQDLQRFKQITLGHPILMGRLTYESIGRPLPGRRNLVMSHDRQLQISGCTVVSDLDAAIAAAAATELQVIGGAKVYEQALPRAERIYLTRVHANVTGDTYFPALDPGEWIEVSREPRPADERHAYAYSFIVLERAYGARLTAH
jgi:dihydrofolate reductase